MNGPGLQRRPGRRKSITASPSSPTFQRKHGRSNDMPVFSNEYQATSAESPTIDLTVPSPTFDLTTFSQSLNIGDAERSSPEVKDDRRSLEVDISRQSRPSISHAKTTPTPQSLTSSPEPTFIGGYRSSVEGNRRSISREQDEGLQRSATFWQQYDRSAEELPKHLANNRKSKFNLLNPMSLLARRRSSQNTSKLDDVNLNVSTLHVPAIPDNITPSIRGTRVHDFSAPRAKRINNENSPRPGMAPSPNYPRRPSDIASPPVDIQGTPASMHSPMFKEHFVEESRTVRPSSTAYLHTQNFQAPARESLPTFAKSLPLHPPDEDPPEVPIKIESPDDSQAIPTEPDHAPPPPPPKTSSPTLEVPRHALPKHMASTSSRFSFIGEQGSAAQEKLMEDKHKEHASKVPQKVRFSTTTMDDGMDDYDDYGNYDEDDGFDTGDIEIKNVDMPSSQVEIPQMSVNMYNDWEQDHEDDDFDTGSITVRNIDVPTSYTRSDQDESLAITLRELTVPERDPNRNSLQAFHFTPQSLTFSPTTTHHTSQSTPRDPDGIPIGMAQFREGFTPRIRDSSDRSTSNFLEGLGISSINEDARGIDKAAFDDSDLYFDDGEFDGEFETGETFDEDALDDPSQVHDIPAENQRRYQEAMDAVNQPTANTSMMPNSLLTRTSLADAMPLQMNLQDGLTEDNLAAHHDALTLALNKAAASGAFDRTVSFGQASDDETDSPFHASVPGISSRGSRYSNNMISSAISDDDDDFDDDAMIAAANAEALENDDDGFYGQEFGFFARSHGRETAEMINGGYFTARGSNGIKRSHSGKNNFQEPSLTPITERSEWSTRNSIASLPMHTGLPNGQSLPSPGIAQLLEFDSPITEDEMSIKHLMKLRNKAFGGSSSSLNSLNERYQQQSSPLAHAPGHTFLRTPSLPTQNFAECEEDEEDETRRQTLVQTTPMKKHAEPSRHTSDSSREQEIFPSSPVSRRGHSRNSSGAESVSYARENDGRWVLERRRTGDSGELDIVEREYLAAGARI